jgi:WD40 repeat protein
MIKHLKVTISLFIVASSLVSQNKNISWVNWGEYDVTGWGHEMPKGILCATYLNNGKTAIIGEAHRTIVWNTQTARIDSIIDISKDPTRSVCRLPVDSLFASATGNVVSFWNSHSLFKYDSLIECGSIYEIGFSNNGRFMFTISDSAGRNIRLWDYKKKQLIKDFRKQFHNVFAASFSSDGNLLLLGVDIEIGGADIQDYSTLIWDVSGNKIIQRHHHATQKPTCVRYSPNGKYIASGCEYVESKWGDSNDTTLRVWDAYNGDYIQTFTDYLSSVTDIAFSPQSNSIASIASDGQVNIQMIRNEGPVINLKNKNVPQAPITFSPDGQVLLSGSASMKAEIWDVKKGSISRTLDSKIVRNSHSNIWAVAYSPDGRFVSSVDANVPSQIILWSASDGRQLSKLESGVDRGIKLSISNAGKHIAYGNRGVIEIWQTSKHELVTELKGHQIPTKLKNYQTDISGYAFSSNGKYLASGAIDGDVRLWDIGSGECLQVFHSPVDKGLGVRSISYDDNDSIVIAGYSGFILGWSIAQHKIVYNLKDDAFRLIDYDKIFKLDTNTLLSSSNDEPRANCRLWDIPSGTIVNRFQIDYKLNAISLSPNKKYIAFSSRTERPTSLKIWDISAGKVVCKMATDIAYIRAIEWSPDGKKIFSGSTDGTVAMWNVPQSFH